MDQYQQQHDTEELDHYSEDNLIPSHSLSNSTSSNHNHAFSNSTSSNHNHPSISNSISSLHHNAHQSNQAHQAHSPDVTTLNPIITSPSMLIHNYSFHHVPSSMNITKNGSTLSNRHGSTLGDRNVSTLDDRGDRNGSTLDEHHNSPGSTLNNNNHPHSTPSSSQSDETTPDQSLEAKSLPINPLSSDYIPFYILILGFFLLFTSYSLVQNLSVALFGASTGSITIGIVYIFFIFSALLAPVMLTTKEMFNNNGLFMMFIGSISYTLLTIACCFGSFPLLIIGAILVGLSAGLVWVGYSVTLNAYARINAERLWYKKEISLHEDARTQFFMQEHLARNHNPKSSQLTEDLFVSPSLQIRKGRLEHLATNLHQQNQISSINTMSGHYPSTLDKNIPSSDSSHTQNTPSINTNSTQIITTDQSHYEQSNGNETSDESTVTIGKNPLLTANFDPNQSLQYTNSLLLPNSRVAVHLLDPTQTSIIDATTNQILGLLNAIAWAFLNLDVVFGGLFSYFILAGSKSKIPETTPSEMIVTSGGGGDIPSDVNSRPLFIFLACASTVANILYFLALVKSPQSLYDLPPTPDEVEASRKGLLREENGNDGKKDIGGNSLDKDGDNFQEFQNLEDIKLTSASNNHLTSDGEPISIPSSSLKIKEKNPLFIISRSLNLIWHCFFQQVFLLSLPSWFAIAIPICFTYTLFTAYYVKPVLGTENIALVMMVVAGVDSVTSILVSKLLKSLRWARLLGIFGSSLQLVLIFVIITIIDPVNDSVNSAWVKSIIIASLCGFSDAFTQIPTNAAIGMIVDRSNGSREVQGACFGLSTVIKSSGSIFIFLSGKFIGFTTQQWCIVVIVTISIIFQIINMMKEKAIDVDHLQEKYDGFAM